MDICCNFATVKIFKTSYMKIELFLNFDGNCREAVEFYAKVFKSEVSNFMVRRHLILIVKSRSWTRIRCVMPE